MGRVFGRPAYTMTSPPGSPSARHRVLSRLRAAAAARRGLFAVLRELPPPLPGETATRHLNRALEALVRECPGKYLWS